MVASEGSVKNISEDDLQREATKIYLLFDLIFFCIFLPFVFLYLQLTPFSKGFEGFTGFALIVIVSYLCFLLCYHFGEKYKSSIFSKYYSYQTRQWQGDIHAMLAKSREGNNILLGICFVIVWVGALFYAPGNTYKTEFKPNVISWLDQGKCDEIKKYDDKVASFCSDIVGVARKNTKGSFVVLNKNLTAGATGCVYMLQSNSSGASVITTKPQTCDIALNQKVFIEVHSFVSSYDRGDGDKYAYTLEAVPTP